MSLSAFPIRFQPHEPRILVWERFALPCDSLPAVPGSEPEERALFPAGCHHTCPTETRSQGWEWPPVENRAEPLWAERLSADSKGVCARSSRGPARLGLSRTHGGGSHSSTRFWLVCAIWRCVAESTSLQLLGILHWLQYDWSRTHGLLLLLCAYVWP